MKWIFGLVGVIGMVLWLTGNLAMPMDKAMETLNGMLPEEMQQHPELLSGGEPRPEVTVVATESPQEDDTPEDGRLRAEVLSIQDGDTLTVGYPTGDDRVRIRLVGIDTPESQQAGGDAARKYLIASIGSHVLVEAVDRDQYGRVLAVVWASERAEASVNYQLVLAGMAYAYMSDDPHLAAAEDEARLGGRGVWADPNAVRPSEWRRMNR